jgi:DNA-binding NarL/FixJ family response regulator
MCRSDVPLGPCGQLYNLICCLNCLERGQWGVRPRGEWQRDPTDERPALARIVIADDHPAYRGILNYLFSNEASLKVVGEAADGAEVLELCRRLQPELVVMDIKMPKMDGWDATRTIKKECPSTRVLVLTAVADPHNSSKALEVGADGYVLKYTPLEKVLEETRRVLSSEAMFPQE